MRSPGFRRPPGGSAWLRSVARRVGDNRQPASGDRGAALLIALIFITVVAIVMGAVLSFADVSMRTTVAVRAEAGQAAAADGAAQVATNALRQGTYTGTGNCFGGSNTLPLTSFYQLANGSTYSASVACTQDTTDSATAGGVAVSGTNKPANAILTLGTSASEDGLNITISGNDTLQVHGRVFSNSNIKVKKNMASNAAITARTACSGTITSVPPPACNVGGPLAADPNYPAPPAATVVQSVPACRGSKKVVTFSPGLYTNLAGLNNLTNSCNGTYWFPPGTYYFNFSGVWSLNSGYLVGGTPAPGQVADGVVPTLPGACVPPIPPDPPPVGGWTPPPPGGGVRFVFGGASRIALSKGAMELCATYSVNAVPIAIYGLKTAIGSGALAVPAENGCITTIGGSGCPVITSDNSPSSEMYIQGTVYVPLARIDIQLNNHTGQVFRYGVIARSLAVSPTGSANLSGPVIETPDDAPGGGTRTVLYLQVYVCSGGSACATSGTPQLKAKIGIQDPTGAPIGGARQIVVYSWSVQR